MTFKFKFNLVLLIIIFFGLAKALPAHAKLGWILRQRTQVGLYNVYIVDSCIRVDELNLHYSIVSKAPDWDVTVFRTDKKTRCKISFKRWMKEGLFEMNERSFIEPIGKVAKKQPKVISKLKYLEYTKPFKQVRRYSKGRIVDLTGFMALDRNVKKIHAQDYKLLVCPKVSTNKRIIDFLSSLFVVPIGEGVPVKFTINFKEGPKQHPLLTSRVAQANLNPKIFALPKKLNNVKNIQLVTTGKSTKELDSMIMDLGIGKDFGK